MCLAHFHWFALFTAGRELIQTASTNQRFRPTSEATKTQPCEDTKGYLK